MGEKRQLLIRLREEANLSQEEVASKIGIAQQTVSQLETGARNPSLSLAKKFELFYDTSMEELFPDLFNNFNITKRGIDQKSA